MSGPLHSFGLKADGSIVAWGRNDTGQCDIPSPNSNFIAVSSSSVLLDEVYSGHSLGLKTDGSIVAWGLNKYGQCNVPTPNSGFVAIATGWNHSLGLKADGSIVTWGDNYYGQCDIPLPNTGYVVIATGGYHNLALKAEGAIVGKAKFKDFANFSAYWNRTDCGPMFWCNGQDINRSGEVDIDDLLAFSTYWLTE
jgi:alpha-tubulin suppressor-like RCC1 family protein